MTRQILEVKRDRALHIHVADETIFSGGRSVWIGDSLIIKLRGSKDVYYFNMTTGALFVYRAKLKEINGCIHVRDREEYNQVYTDLQYYGFNGMPENMFTRLDREWEQRDRSA